MSCNSNYYYYPWENAFFIDTKLQSKTEVILINKTKFTILFVRVCLSEIAIVNTSIASDLK